MNDNDPMSPIVQTNQDGGSYIVYQGLTKREYFIAMAMQGLAGQAFAHTSTDEEFAEHMKIVAETAVRYADVVIGVIHGR